MKGENNKTTLIDYRIIDPSEKVNEPSEKVDEAQVLLNSMIAAGKKVLAERLQILHSDLNIEKANVHIVETHLESVLILCKRAVEEGKLDKDVYKQISLVVSEGQTNNYIPKSLR